MDFISRADACPALADDYELLFNLFLVSEGARPSTMVEMLNDGPRCVFRDGPRTWECLGLVRETYPEFQYTVESWRDDERGKVFNMIDDRPLSVDAESDEKTRRTVQVLSFFVSRGALPVQNDDNHEQYVGRCLGFEFLGIPPVSDSEDDEREKKKGGRKRKRDEDERESRCDIAAMQSEVATRKTETLRMTLTYILAIPAVSPWGKSIREGWPGCDSNSGDDSDWSWPLESPFYTEVCTSERPAGSKLEAFQRCARRLGCEVVEARVTTPSLRQVVEAFCNFGELNGDPHWLRSEDNLNNLRNFFCNISSLCRTESEEQPCVDIYSLSADEIIGTRGAPSAEQRTAQNDLECKKCGQRALQQLFCIWLAQIKFKRCPESLFYPLSAEQSAGTRAAELRLFDEFLRDPKAGYGRFIAEAFAEEIEQLPRRRRAAFEEAKCQLYKEYDRLVARRWGGAASNSA